MTEPAAVPWQAQRERAVPVVLVTLIWLARILGRRAAPPFLWIATGYYLVAARAAVRASRDFLGRALGRAATLRDVARHIHTFATNVFDRVFFLLNRGDQFEVRIDRSPEAYRACYESGRGCLLFVAHLGSFEVLRVVASGAGRIRVLLDKDHGATFTALLERLNPGVAADIIDASQGGPGVALAVKQALDEDMRVGVMVDRARAGEQTVTVDFFGRPARFPAGPWMMAAALQAPVVLVFCPFLGGTRYDAHFELFSERLVIPRAQRQQELQACVQRFAARLEHHARRHPYNWFNFYDFWA